MSRYLPTKGPVGKNTLATIVRRGLIAARESGAEAAALLKGVTMTNHSTRVTTVTRLRAAGHDEASIMAQTGHRSVAGLRPYMREKVASAITRADDLSIKANPAQPPPSLGPEKESAAPTVVVDPKTGPETNQAGVQEPANVPQVAQVTPPAVIDVNSVHGPIVGMNLPSMASEAVIGAESNVGRSILGGPQMWGPYCMPTINININGRGL